MEKWLKQIEQNPMMLKVDTILKIVKIVRAQMEALEEIEIMFDGEADIDNHGNPNRAMTIDGIIGDLKQSLDSIAKSNP